MKKILFILTALPLLAASQTYLPITNNMNIAGNSYIRFIAGDYSFTDPESDGVVRISNASNVILDGEGCTVNGSNYEGYFIKMDNCHNIIIRNFDSVFRYKYALYITNSDHIQIYGNKFCRNKTDSTGWIDVWTDYQGALGGGVMMYQCRAARIFNNTMNLQNDGVAVYHCDSLEIHDNIFDWNTSYGIRMFWTDMRYLTVILVLQFTYGIRMFWTDSCNIYNNSASHINRPFTDPSDCAALLMIISNNNRVEYNDLSWSGDGVFLGQYRHSEIPNNNYFAFNECSYSPHNAIEATFADGNVYKHNLCNYSHYGLWLGYSFNSVVDSNEIIGNFNSGIAIDRGFNNYIAHNTIKKNPIGIELWEGSPISGYTNYTSHDYIIHNNVIEGNTVGVSAKASENSHFTDNKFLYNQVQAINLEGVSSGDTVSNNDFRMTTAFHIRNYSTNDIYAPQNNFIPNDSLLIENHLYDKKDLSNRGAILWYPPNAGPAAMIQVNPPCDLAEPSSTWYAYPEIGYPGPRIPDTLIFDTNEKVVGEASVKLIAGRGWYLALNYRPDDDSIAQWNLGETDTLYFKVRTVKQVQYGFQYFHIRIGDDKGNYYKYTASTSLLNNANLQWKSYKMPLAGNTTFSRTIQGSMSFSNKVSYVEFWADTWDYGFTLWLDGVQFHPCDPLTVDAPVVVSTHEMFQLFPNPAHGITTVQYSVETPGKIRLSVFDVTGKKVAGLVECFQQADTYSVNLDTGGFREGIYLVCLEGTKSRLVKKLVVISD